jgi:hypothetical protein
MRLRLDAIISGEGSEVVVEMIAGKRGSPDI